MNKLTVGIIGKGNFGQALWKLFSIYAPDFSMVMVDKMPDSDEIENLANLKNCDIIIPCVPISKFKTVIQQVAAVVKENATVVDICTIKEYSAAIMTEYLPPTVKLIASHPLFGPESLEAIEWKLDNLNLVLWPLRIAKDQFNKLFERLQKTGLNIILKSPKDHDMTLARSQFLSLLTGSFLVKMDIQSTDMNTRSFDELLDVKYTTRHDYNILLDVYRYNPYCKKILGEFSKVVQEVITDLKLTC